MKATTGGTLRNEPNRAAQGAIGSAFDAGSPASQLAKALFCPANPAPGASPPPGDDFDLNLDGSTEICDAMPSSRGDSEGHVSDKACPSQRSSNDCTDIVHQLSNLMTAVLMNAQLLEWKLPPYSHLKRPVHELTRNAQRSSQLLKRLVQRCEALAAITSAEDGSNRHSVSELSLHLTGGCDRCTSSVFPKRDDGSER